MPYGVGPHIKFDGLYSTACRRAVFPWQVLVGLLISLWHSRRDLGRLEIGFDVSRVEESVRGMIEGGERAGRSDTTAGRREVDLDGWVG